jgi:2-dehydropantoate 2-reductase
MTFPRVAVVGAGAVGSYFGGMLARAGAPVTLIGRSSHVDVWTREGLVIDSFRSPDPIKISVSASTEISAAADAGLVLFCVKGPDTETTARQLSAYLRDDALVISLQNGVDNVTRMRPAGVDAIAAVVYVASAMSAPGRLQHNSRGELVIGDLPGRREPARDEAIARVASWFEAAGVPCQVSPNVEADLWTKLIVNASLNPISALANLPYGETIATSESRDLIARLVLECVAVARAGNVALPEQDWVPFILSFAARLKNAYASTAQDLARGRRTEVDTLNGFLVQRGMALGVPTPANQAMLALIKLREYEQERRSQPQPQPQ